MIKQSKVEGSNTIPDRHVILVTRERPCKKAFTLLGPVHAYPYILASATFSFWIQKFLRPQVAKISGFAAEFARCVWTEAVSGKKKLRI